MKKNLQFALLLGLMSATAVSANAESQWDCHNCKIFIEDFAIKKGETKTISICVNNPDYDFTAGQFDMYFKGGITPVLNKSNKIAMTLGARVPGYEDGFSGTGSWQSDGGYRYLFYNNDGNYVEDTSGTLFTFKITTDETFGTTGEAPAIEFGGELKLSDIEDTSHGHILDPTHTNVYEAVPLAEFITKQAGKQYYIADAVKVIAKTTSKADKTYAFVTDGNDNWLKVALSEADNQKFVEGQTYEGYQLGGEVLNAELNPVTTLERALGYKVASTPISAGVESVDLSRHFELASNQVVSVAGYFFNDDNQETLRAYSGANGERGQSLSLDFSFVDNNMVNGNPYVISKAAVELKAAWTTPTGAPALVAPSDANSFQNYVITPLEMAQIATGVNDLNAKAVSSVRYINVAGMESTTPFQGVNLVVTTYTDGTTSTAKVIK